ncbi:MAG: aldehyde dehydrogenase family protein, partial [Spirochaetaceae bacterium]|nr:aldehyde dehydrogenase family protein [Spirochaetaceae bacterium]MCF7951629.1 aldehyde dehydrogenase family protein [Spirochaetaceae bacterium]
SLELGGNDAMIVLEDANLKRAAAGAAWAGLSNCGQSCGGVERIYVIDSVYDKFLSLLKDEVAALRQGDDTAGRSSENPDSEQTEPVHYDFGSLTTTSQQQTVQQHLQNATGLGATIAVQSPAQDSVPAEEAITVEAAGLFHPAIILESVNHDMEVIREETFGPLLAVHKVASAAEAVEKANDSDLGLTGSVWSRSRPKARAVADQIQAGAVTINDHLMSHGMPETPWGGYKNSAIGRSHGTPGFEEMTQPKVVIHDFLAGATRNIWWYPHSSEVLKGLSGALDVLTSPSLSKKLTGAAHLVPLYIKRLLSKR